MPPTLKLTITKTLTLTWGQFSLRKLSGYLFWVGLFFELRNVTHPWWSFSTEIVLISKNRLTLFAKKFHHICLTRYQIRICLPMVLYQEILCKLSRQILIFEKWKPDRNNRLRVAEFIYHNFSSGKISGFSERHKFHCVCKYILSESCYCMDNINVKITSFIKIRKRTSASMEISRSFMISFWLCDNSDQNMSLNAHVLRYEFT